MNSASIQAEKAEFMTHRMRRNALIGLPAGALIVGAFLVAFVQGRAIPGPTLAFVILGGGMLVVSIRVLLPSYPESVKRRLARLEGLAKDKQRTTLDRMIRDQLLAVAAALLIEIPIAIVFWALDEWRPIIVGAVGTTLVLVLSLAVIFVRRTRIPPGRVPR